MSKAKYINFPVQLLEGFLVDDHNCLNNIICYGCYAHSLKLDYGTPEEVFSSASKYFGFSFDNSTISYNNGQELYDSLPDNCPKVGFSLNILWDYHDNYKSEFEKICLLGFLAIKSIIQNKTYCKITNKYWLSRMDGRPKAVRDQHELSCEIKKFANEYQTKKIKNELMLNWGLKHYSRYTRGFYVSFKLSLDDLVFEAEKRRKSTKEKQLKKDIAEAMAKAKKRLGG